MKPEADSLKSKDGASFWNRSRKAGLWVVFFCYLTALPIALLTFHLTPAALTLRLLAADAAATVVIWLFSLFLDNASVYDPYWSVLPPVLFLFLLLRSGTVTAASVLLFLLLCLWGIRLTGNWAITFSGLHRQDWRYDRIRSRTGPWYPLASLLGIHLMPTLIVFACMLPAVLFLSRGAPLHPAMLLGLAVSLSGLVLETVSDRQMRAFRRESPDRSGILRTGLWRYARHPNYLGEILFWWGIYLYALPTGLSAWVYGAGAAANTALFLLISIPMAERRLAEYKSDYEAYCAQTRALIPLPRSRSPERGGIR